MFKKITITYKSIKVYVKFTHSFQKSKFSKLIFVLKMLNANTNCYSLQNVRTAMGIGCDCASCNN